MKKYLLGVLIALSGLFAAASAQAQSGQVVVHIQQDFIAGGKALPAGTYRIFQDLSGSAKMLKLTGDQPGTTVFLLPIAHDDPSSEPLKAKLTRVDDVYYLSEVATDLGVFTLAPPSAAVTRMAKARGFASTSSGSN
jgi:hypothetical protein